MRIGPRVGLNNSNHNRNNQNQQEATAGDENRIESPVGYSFNFKIELEKQLGISHTEWQDKSQQKREKARHWFFIKILWLGPSGRKCGFLAKIYHQADVAIPYHNRNCSETALAFMTEFNNTQISPKVR
jgi:hypothetical protein